jgi:hypothetical protein
MQQLILCIDRQPDATFDPDLQRDLDLINAPSPIFPSCGYANYYISWSIMSLNFELYSSDRFPSVSIFYVHRD